MRKPWNIAVATQLSSDPDRKAFEGAISYGGTHSGFQFRAIRFVEDEELPGKLQQEEFDGAIINITRLVFAPLAEQFPSIPMVNLGADKPAPEIPTVMCRGGEGSRVLMEHLRNKGYCRFGYVTPFPEESQDARIANLRDLLHDDEGTLETYHLPGFDYDYAQVDDHVDALAQWLGSFLQESTPTAILTLDGYRAAAIAQACRSLKLEVPATVGIAAYCDSRTCLTQSPSITSLETPAFELGYTAMQILHQLLEGHPPPTKPVEIQGGRVVVRESTAPPALFHDEIEFVIDYMQKNIHRNISVKDCLRQLETVSRASFYRNFAKQMGMSPAEYLRSLKIDRAKELLIGTSQSVDQVARQTGFSSRTQFGSTFKQIVGKSPSQYRREMKGQPEQSPSTSG